MKKEYTTLYFMAKQTALDAPIADSYVGSWAEQCAKERENEDEED